MKRKRSEVSKKIVIILLTVCIMLWCAPKDYVFAQDYTDGQEETDELDVRKPTGLEELQVEIIDEEELDDEEVGDGEEDIDTYVIYSSDAADYWKSMGNDYIYSQLSAQEQKVWDTLETYCIRYAESDEDCNKIYPNVYLTDVSSEEASNFVRVFYYSHPQYFFLSNSIGLSSSGNQIRPALYIDEAFRDGASRQAAVTEFKAKIDSWVSEIRACDTVVAKEKKAIEILADNTIYSDESPLNQSAYSLVCEGKTVCAGYCATFAIVMNMAGVETQVITGDANGGHGWNTVKVHDVWYVVDPTWADQNNEKKTGYFYGIAYRYFNRADATISENRTRDVMWEQYYKPANYDSGTDSLSYVDPYFTEGNYKYFTVNNNTNLAVLYALPIEALNGVTISAAPETVLHASKTYNKYVPVPEWKEPKVTMCVGCDYDCSDSLSDPSAAVSWTTENADVATVNNGVVTAKASGTTKIIATVGTSQFSFEITVRNHNFAKPTFDWAEDKSSCKATRVCSYDETHKETADCVVRSQVYREATCCTQGVTRYTATAFDTSDTKDITNIEINKNVHVGSTKKMNVKQPTCTEKGYTGDTYCSACNGVLLAGTPIDALGHNMTKVVSQKKEATCIAPGKEAVRGCTRCDYKEGGEEIGVTDHKYENGTCIVCSATLVSGWTKDDTGWKYRKEDGTFITSAWKSDNGKWYYFNDNGYMVTGWQKLGTKWYYFTGSGSMVTGWQQIGTKWYYFTGSGAMVTGWQQIGGKWYFFASSGTMATGWQLLNNKWYYFETSGAMVTGWKQISNKWYYFEKSGAMAVSKWINGTYYVKANGVMATNEWVDGGRYYVDGNGKWVPGKTR